MRIIFLLVALAGSIQLCSAQAVGVNTTTPQAGFHVKDTSVIFSATGDIPPYLSQISITGAGRRMMWYPGKAAFRAGYVYSNEWNTENVGKYSFAAGLGTMAKGNESVALGNNGHATGDRAFAFNGTASAVGAVAIGSGAQAIGDDALSLGPSSIASGLASITIGPSIAPANFGVAIGLQNRAGGQFSTVIGKNARANHQGAMVLGDASASFSSDSVYSSANNQMTMRFVGGYRLFTTQNLSTGVQVAAGGGSWSSISDVRKKENIQAINTDDILNKISSMNITQWNYKTQPSSQKHIGPMAQDFYAAFGLDGVGNDTTINMLDFDGVNMAAIQALEKRTATQAKELAMLKAEIAKRDEEMAQIREQNNKLLQQLADLNTLKEQIMLLQKQTSTSSSQK